MALGTFDLVLGRRRQPVIDSFYIDEPLGNCELS